MEGKVSELSLRAGMTSAIDISLHYTTVRVLRTTILKFQILRPFLSDGA